MALKDFVKSDPEVLRVKPCLKNTRIPVALVLGYLAGGFSIDQITEEYPDLTAEGVAACLDYSHDLDFEIAA